METKQEAVHQLYGKTQELLLPSGIKAVIREQNGADDDIISNTHLHQNGQALNTFISAILVSLEGKEGRLSPTDVSRMKVRDKYFILISSRIFSLGAKLKFTYDWLDESTPPTYIENLEIYLWDYSKPFPEEGDADYFQYRMKPYNDSDDLRKLSLTSGKEVRYKYLTGEGEQKMLDMPQDRISKNTEFIVRDLELLNPQSQQWQKVSNFKAFSSRDMIELRKDLKENDAPFDAISEIEHPVTGQKQLISLVAVEDFFFPVEI